MTDAAREQSKFPNEERAQKAAYDTGFCLGEMQRDDPRGLMLNCAYIAKWRNLTAADKAELHGAYHRKGRDGPVVVTLQPNCPLAAAQMLRDAADAEQL